MDELNIEEVRQLAVFYKQRANELELLSLQNQLVSKRLDAECKNLKHMMKSLQDKVDALEKEKSGLLDEINSLSEPNNSKTKSKKNK